MDKKRVTNPHQCEEVCARKDCANKPTKIYEVAYLHKKGRFCESCAKELLMDDLLNPDETEWNSKKEDVSSDVSESLASSTMSVIN